jgi:hypothetical protein
VDHFSDADLTDVEELERQLATSTGTAGEQTQAINTTAGTEKPVDTGAGQPSPLQPGNEPPNATLPTAQQIAYLLQGLQAPSPALQLPQTTINDTVLTTLTQAVTALTALTTGARPGPPRATAGEDPRIEPVRSRFPAVDPALLVEILENRFKVENLPP